MILSEIEPNFRNDDIEDYGDDKDYADFEEDEQKGQSRRKAGRRS